MDGLKGRTREDAIRKFGESRAIYCGMHAPRPSSERTYGFTVTNDIGAENAKPASSFPVPPQLSSLTSISVARLVPGTTHRGRVLRGTIIALPIYSGSAQTTLVEDEAGDVVTVSPPPSPSAPLFCVPVVCAPLYLLQEPPRNVFSNGFNIH